MSELSLYVHVPFCKSKCSYCDFYSAPGSSGAVSAYADALCNQIRESKDAGAEISTVYFGGGTPSLLSKSSFSAICAALRETFDLSALTEWTVECNPESVSEEKTNCWLNCGVNRVSMGVQSFSDPCLNRLGRVHTGAQAKIAYGILRKTGVKNVSLDLMLALPGQSRADVKNDLEEMLQLQPEHISAYLLSVEPDSRFGREGIVEANEETQRSLYLLTDRILTQAGYEHYEISNFARPGFASRHNTVYWNGGDYLGFGPGAAGFRSGVRYRIPADTERYILSQGRISPLTEEVVNEEERARESIFLGLRRSSGIPFSLIPTEKQALARLLVQRGDAEISSGRFALTASGFLISNQVIASFFSEK